MSDDHLFEPNDLFEIKDFGKVRRIFVLLFSYDT